MNDIVSSYAISKPSSRHHVRKELGLERSCDKILERSRTRNITRKLSVGNRSYDNDILKLTPLEIVAPPRKRSQELDSDLWNAMGKRMEQNIS